VYFVRRGAERTGAVVVNPDSRESDLRRLEVQALRERLRGAGALVTDDPGAWRRSLFRAGNRRPLQVPLLVLALALLAAETFVVRRTEHPAAA
jgi:hypothetical protein